MPVEFLTDDEAAAYGRYAGAPSQADLERVFFLDDEDRKLADLRRGDHMKAGFALQLVTVRWLGTFLEDPLDVPAAVLDFVAGQFGMADPSVVKRYTERVKTKSDHQQEIRRAQGLRDFAEAEAELAEWVAARAWTSGDGPKAIEAADQRALSRVVGRYGRLDLLLLDELGYVQVDHRGAELLFQIITEREERAAVAIGTNLPFSEWGTVFPDPRLVAAIVDRVTFNAHILETGTQSYRLRASKTTSRGKSPS